MRTSPLQPVIQQLRKAVLIRDGAGLTDGQLLTLFIEQRDQAAFEALVRRHGPMVMGVCRRVLRHPQDSEDAFQATFLVLVRKAASVVPREMVSNWLYGVARTTALRANAVAAKRRQRERQVREMPEPEAVQPDLWHDLRPLLDQELSWLPDKYRIAIVLCDLEGKSHKEAARQLGWPQGTLSGRLARARKLLADRLRRHGLAVSGGVLAGMLAQNGASASVPASLVSSTVKAASLLAVGQAAVAGLVSLKAAALTEGVVIAMLLNKLKVVTMVLMAATFVGGAGLLYRTQAAEPEKKTPIPGLPADWKPPEPSSRKLLSNSPMPRPAVVSVDKGQLVVQTLDVSYQPKTVLFGGKTYTSYQKSEILRTNRYDFDVVKACDMKTRALAMKGVAAFIGKEERLALVTTDLDAVDPLNLNLFKEGMYLFILPAPAEPVPPRAFRAAPPLELAPAVSYPPPPVLLPAPTAPPVAHPELAVPQPPAAPAFPVPPLHRAALAPQIVLAPGAPDIHEVHTLVVRIPVLIEPGGKAKLIDLSLLASVDQGKTWDKVQTISPEEDFFVFRAPKDGLYWFNVQALARDGKTEPIDLAGTMPPQLKLEVKAGGGQVEQKGRQNREPSLEVVSKAWMARWKDYEDGKGTQDILYRVARRLFQVQLAKAKSRDEWITAWQAHVDRLQRIERANKDRYEAGRISVQDYQASIRWRRHAINGLLRAIGQ